MEITEFRFKPAPIAPELRKRFSLQYIEALETFFSELARNGLALETGAQITQDKDGSYICRIIACDERAITEHNFSYDTKKALSRLLDMSDGLPQFSNVGHDPLHHHCKCRQPSHLVLNPCAEWEGTPVQCGDCTASIPLYRLVRHAGDMEFDDVLRWRRLYRAYLYQCLIGIDSIDGHESYQMLHECVSTLSLAGRALAGQIEQAVGIPVYYPIYYKYERVSDVCPQCGERWRNSYPDGVKFSHVCLGCRLVSSEAPHKEYN